MVSAVPTVRFPVNWILPVVSVSATVAALTVLWKSIPPELVTVTVPMSVPTAPETVTVPATLKVTFDAVPDAVPLMLVAETVPFPPVPSIRVTPSASVMAAMVRAADPAFSVELPVKVAGLLKVIASSDVVTSPAVLMPEVPVRLTAP